jgi:hypothetical protein
VRQDDGLVVHDTEDGDVGMLPKSPQTKTLLGSAGSLLPGRITTDRTASARRRPVRSGTAGGQSVPSYAMGAYCVIEPRHLTRNIV